MTTARQACCSSPVSILYWCAISLVAWGGLSLVGLYWYPLHATSAATVCLAMAIGCAANWFKNRTLHCGITGPMFLIAGIVFLLFDTGVLAIGPGFVWSAVAIVTACSFLLEWRYAARSRRCSASTH